MRSKTIGSAEQNNRRNLIVREHAMHTVDKDNRTGVNGSTIVVPETRRTSIYYTNECGRGRTKVSRGVHPPKPLVHFPLFQITPLLRIFPLFSEYFRVWKHFSNSSQKVYISSAKNSYDFFSHWLRICIFPLFSQKGYIPPLSENLFSSASLNFPPLFR